MERVRIAVVGAGGFVGSNLVRRFHAKGWDVHAMVRPATNLWRLRGLQDGVTIHRVSTDSISRFGEALSAIRPEGVIHAAAVGGGHAIEEISRVFKTNVEGLIAVTHQAFRAGATWMVATGSSSEYGLARVPMRESRSLRPITYYGISKAAGTQFCQAFGRMNNRKVFVLRLFSPFGPFESMERLVPAVILGHLNELPLRLANPRSVRDFIYIEDVVDAYEAVIRHSDRLEAGSVLNVGSGVQHTVLDVVNRVAKITGRSPSRQWNALVSTDVGSIRSWVADTHLITRLTGWRSRYDLESGLKETCRWFAAHRGLYGKPAPSKPNSGIGLAN